MSISKRGNFEVCCNHKSINSGSGSASNSSREDLVTKKRRNNTSCNIAGNDVDHYKVYNRNDISILYDF